MLSQIKVIGFDAADTLWINEPFYQDIEKEFCQIMRPYMIGKETSVELFKTEMQNLEIYGYGAKAVHILFEVTWQHENNHEFPDNNAFITVSAISEILNII